MSTYPSALQNPDPTPLYARKFRVICEMHNIKIGAPEDLEAFLEKLESDRHFAMDFWGLAGKISAREGGTLSDEQMLALFVEGVTARPLPTTADSAMDPAIALFRAMLAGVDVHRPESSPSPGPPRTAPVAPIDEARSRLASIDEPKPRRFSAGLASMPQPPELEPGPGPLPSQLHLALQSLEIVSRNLNDHVGKIDRRLAGLEVKVTKQASQTEAIAPLLRSAVQVQKPAEKPKFAVDLAAALTNQHRRPFETYPSQRDVNWRKNVTLAVIFLTGLLAVFTWNYYSEWLREGLHAVVREDLETPAGSIWHRDNRPPVLLPSTPRPVPASTDPQPSEDVSTQPAEPPHYTAAPKEAASRPAAQVEQDLMSLPGSINVAAAEMEKNLIASRVPIYPEAAKLERVEGPVVAQALISKKGAVTRVHVITGDSRLRSAAAEAIYQRHYRPYRLNGRPVDVSTFITVNFKLNG